MFCEPSASFISIIHHQVEYKVISIKSILCVTFIAERPAEPYANPWKYGVCYTAVFPTSGVPSWRSWQTPVLASGMRKHLHNGVY